MPQERLLLLWFASSLKLRDHEESADGVGNVVFAGVASLVVEDVLDGVVDAHLDRDSLSPVVIAMNHGTAAHGDSGTAKAFDGQEIVPLWDCGGCGTRRKMLEDADRGDGTLAESLPQTVLELVACELADEDGGSIVGSDGSGGIGWERTARNLGISASRKVTSHSVLLLRWNTTGSLPLH